MDMNTRGVLEDMNIAGRKRYGTPYFKALRINRNPFLAVSSI